MTVWAAKDSSSAQAALSGGVVGARYQPQNSLGIQARLMTIILSITVP